VRKQVARGASATRQSCSLADALQSSKGLAWHSPVSCSKLVHIPLHYRMQLFLCFAPLMGCSPAASLCLGWPPPPLHAEVNRVAQPPQLLRAISSGGCCCTCT
jgi:hypothetical protein